MVKIAYPSAQLDDELKVVKIDMKGSAGLRLPTLTMCIAS